MLALIIIALSCAIHVPRHLATSHHHYTISNGALATMGSLALAAKVKWALCKHTCMLHICLRRYVAAVVQLWCCDAAMMQLSLCKSFVQGKYPYALASLSSGLSGLCAANAYSELSPAPGLLNLSVQTSGMDHLAAS